MRKLEHRFAPAMNNFVNMIASWFEHRAYGVCSWWGKKLGIKATKIRMYFIYLSFFTVGSPVIVYFIMAFVLEHKESFKPRNWFRRQRGSIWDI